MGRKVGVVLLSYLLYLAPLLHSQAVVSGIPAGSTLQNNAVTVTTSAGLQSTGVTVGTTTILTPATSGLYAFWGMAFLSAAGSAGTFQMCVQYNNGSATVDQCGGNSSLTGALGSTNSTFLGIFWANAGSNIQYFITFTGATGSPTVKYSYVLQQVQ